LARMVRQYRERAGDMQWWGTGSGTWAWLILLVVPVKGIG
jgi:hypothetical protein